MYAALALIGIGSRVSLREHLEIEMSASSTGSWRSCSANLIAGSLCLYWPQSAAGDKGHKTFGTALSI